MQQINSLSLKFTTVRLSVFLRATPLEVYHALLDPSKRAEWTGEKATGEAKVGSIFTTTDGYVSVKNLELVEGKLILQEWKTKEWPDEYPPSLVKYSLKPERGGTRLTLNHSKVPATIKDYINSGWDEYNWKPLKNYFAKIVKEGQMKE